MVSDFIMPHTITDSYCHVITDGKIESLQAKKILTKSYIVASLSWTFHTLSQKNI